MAKINEVERAFRDNESAVPLTMTCVSWHNNSVLRSI
jgi:hypothetical protein